MPSGGRKKNIRGLIVFAVVPDFAGTPASSPPPDSRHQNTKHLFVPSVIIVTAAAFPLTLCLISRLFRPDSPVQRRRMTGTTTRHPAIYSREEIHLLLQNARQDLRVIRVHIPCSLRHSPSSHWPALTSARFRGRQNEQLVIMCRWSHEAVVDRGTGRAMAGGVADAAGDSAGETHTPCPRL